MRKHVAMAAVGVALAGAAILPAGSAFGRTRKPPGPVATALSCGVLEGLDTQLDAQWTAATDPNAKAFIAALENSNDAKIKSAGCTFTDPTPP